MLKVNVRQLDNKGLDIEGVLEPCELELDTLREDSRATGFKGGIAYSLHVSLVSGGVLVCGIIEASGECVCDRCLENFEMPLENIEVCHYYENVEADEIDISPELREDILITLPMKMLCSEDCQGIKIPPAESGRANCAGKRQADSQDSIWQSLDKLKLKRQT
ncbi:MAG: DUF177 domain-containing protein [Victivallales bacterium]|nr:DUF177 domain-containing protein [Victivallales bacterium]